jgi:hypothetical protein
LLRLVPGSAGTLVWGPLGNVAGRPKRGVAALVTAHNVFMPFEGALTLRLSFLGSGAPVYSYGAVWP